MRKSLLRILILAFICLYLPLRSGAWGMLGHRIVAQIAESYLTEKTRTEIRKILGNESLAMSANWADFIKSDTAYRYLNPWHYINFRKGMSYEEMVTYLKTDSTVDAYTRLNFLVSELKKKNLPQEKKVMYLRLLVHIAGDLHQPLHASPEGSTGGNDIKVNWFNEASNLHRVWDEHLIEYQQLSYTEYVKAINFTTPAQRKQWMAEPLSRWIYDSYVIAGKLHEEIKEPMPRLGFRYNFDHVQTLNEQLLKGGVHLAALLNEIFGK
jgi:hypothetical protein